MATSHHLFTKSLSVTNMCPTSTTIPLLYTLYLQLCRGKGREDGRKRVKFLIFWPLSSFPVLVFQVVLPWTPGFNYPHLLTPKHSFAYFCIFVPLSLNLHLGNATSLLHRIYHGVTNFSPQTQLSSYILYTESFNSKFVPSSGFSLKWHLIYLYIALSSTSLI